MKPKKETITLTCKYAENIREFINELETKHPKIYKAHRYVFEIIREKAGYIAGEAYGSFVKSFTKYHFTIIVFSNRLSRWHRSEIALVIYRDGTVALKKGYKLDKFWTTESKIIERELKDEITLW